MKLITIHSPTNVGNIGPGNRRVFLIDEGTKWIRLFDPHANNTARIRKFTYNDIYVRDENLNRDYWIKKSGEKYGQNANYRKLHKEYASEEENMSMELLHKQTDLLAAILSELKKMNGEEIELPFSNHALPPELKNTIYGGKAGGSMAETKPIKKEFVFDEENLTVSPKKRRGRPPGSKNKKGK